MMTDPRKTVAAVELDHSELTIRLLEIGIKLHRPKGKPAIELLADLREQGERGEIPAYIIADFEAMAAASIVYLRDQINAMQRVS
jgi:hypothetical protein